MVLGKGMFESLDNSRSGDRTGHERDSDRVETLRWQPLATKSRPEAVTITGDCSTTSNSVVTNKVVDFTAFNVRRAVISGASAGIKSGVPFAWPRFGQTSREILRVGTHLKRGNCIALDLPACFRLFQAFQKPRFLLRAEQRGCWLVLAKIRDFLATIFNRCWGMTAVVGAAGVQHFQHFLRKQSREIVAHESLRLSPICRLLWPIVALIGADAFHISSPAHRAVCPKAV